MQVRTPAVAGMFYPKTNQELRISIRDCFLNNYGPGKLYPSSDNQKFIGAICSHAGYVYSVPIAANSYYAMSSEKPSLVIIIGPNHCEIGCNVTVTKERIWKTPLGDIEVDTEAAVEIKKVSKLIEFDFFPHTRVHNLEVQLPMLQEIFSHKFKILPLILIDQSYHTAIEIGKAIATITKIKKTMIVGLSDFTHYEPNDFAYKQDNSLIEAIVTWDISKLYKILEENQICVCSYGAIASTMVDCKELGATKATLIKYATKGDLTGDESSVVGYASILFS
jgi:MEMO1 family protein